MMGSKADMISSKIDEVSRNSIWREHVKKEDAKEITATPFQVNPKKAGTITSKIGGISGQDLGISEDELNKLMVSWPIS